MCALCGAFGGEEHWSTRAEPSGSGQTGRPGNELPGTPTRRAERLARVRAANAVLGAFAMRLDDWQGAAFIVAGPTGQREVVDTLPQVWDAAGRMLGRRIDPLDPALMARIAERARQ